MSTARREEREFRARLNRAVYPGPSSNSSGREEPLRFLDLSKTLEQAAQYGSRGSADLSFEFMD